MTTILTVLFQDPGVDGGDGDVLAGVRGYEEVNLDVGGIGGDDGPAEPHLPQLLHVLDVLHPRNQVFVRYFVIPVQSFIYAKVMEV